MENKLEKLNVISLDEKTIRETEGETFIEVLGAMASLAYLYEWGRSYAKSRL
jgi:hypothetical protein